MNISRITFLGFGMMTVLMMSGCQATKGLFDKFDNGSLAYQQAKKLEPLQLPAQQQTANFIPLYPTPDVGNNTLQLSNETGKRYVLPPPHRAIATPTTN